jgi:glycosyltransferase A (GT-A) superfamily protein (DUF2064 family)
VERNAVPVAKVVVRGEAPNPIGVVLWGYYLLAAEQETPSLFRGITWSTSTVYEETLCRAAEAGLCATTLPECSDVDTAADLPLLFAALTERQQPCRTLDLLQSLQGAFMHLA